LPNSERKLTPAQQATDAFQYNRCELLKKKVLSRPTSLPNFILRAMRREGCFGIAEISAASNLLHLQLIRKRLSNARLVLTTRR